MHKNATKCNKTQSKWCVNKHGASKIIDTFETYQTAQKVLQSGFYWPTLFKDARKFILSCDECQRVGNISRRNEMPMNYSLITEPFDC
jgi:hypothetical protein